MLGVLGLPHHTSRSHSLSAVSCLHSTQTTNPTRRRNDKSTSRPSHVHGRYKLLQRCLYEWNSWPEALYNRLTGGIWLVWAYAYAMRPSVVQVSEQLDSQGS